MSRSPLTSAVRSRLMRLGILTAVLLSLVVLPATASQPVPITSQAPIVGGVDSPDHAGGDVYGGVKQGDPSLPAMIEAHRIMGETRFETAIDVSKRDFPKGSRVVILARHDIPADAIAAIPYAKVMNAPILLTPTDHLHPGTLAEIRRLTRDMLKSHVVIMGGPAAVSTEVETLLREDVDEVHRLSGPTRAATAVAIAQALETLDAQERLFVVDGNDWQAALIAGPAAAAHKAVILIVNGSTLPRETRAYISGFTNRPITAFGKGPSTSGLTSHRLPYDDPTVLSLAVAKAFFNRPTVIGLATSADFPDALSGGAHLGRKGGPIFLINQEAGPDVRQWVRANRTITTAFVYGGEHAVSDSLLSFITGPSNR